MNEFGNDPLLWLGACSLAGLLAFLLWTV